MNLPRILAALIAGILFGFGLALGAMLDPSVVRGFLDFFGAFDPRLAFVFAGALAVSAAGYAYAQRLPRPTLGESFAIPQNQKIDQPLIAGAALFGIGWGMVGLCPGPAIAGLALGVPSIFVFTVAMLVGMAAYELWRGKRISAQPALASE
jgi:uncharacterized membrane protein YedE/YeeE